MDTSNFPPIKSVAFWADLILTVASLLLATKVVASGTPWAQYVGWAIAVLSTLGFHSLLPASSSTPPATPTAAK